MQEGIVRRKQSGFYYVDGGEELVECRVRGRLKKDGASIVVGDRVQFSLISNGAGVIEEVLPRQNILRRPAVANIDQVLAVFSLRDPDPVWSLLDRILVSAELKGIGAVVCLSKIDLAAEDEVARAREVYTGAGYPVVLVSVVNQVGLDAVRKLLKGKITCLAGPSGVGKSSLINALDENINLKTGEISEKLGRGRHTTRHVELLPINSGGLIADTPGFSRLTLDIMPEELDGLFPEIAEYAAGCRFNDCRHANEPGCQVKEAVDAGEIAESRYRSYLDFLQELNEARRY